MDECEAVLSRLERIEALDEAGGTRAELLDELRALVHEAEAWSRREGGEVAARAVDELRAALDTAPEPYEPADVRVFPDH